MILDLNLYESVLPEAPINSKRDILIEYLKVKVSECDWHGVSDAANDLRVLEAREEANVCEGQ